MRGKLELIEEEFACGMKRKSSTKNLEALRAALSKLTQGDEREA
jgi:glycine cleavage system regulatory protein